MPLELSSFPKGVPWIMKDWLLFSVHRSSKLPGPCGINCTVLWVPVCIIYIFILSHESLVPVSSCRDLEVMGPVWSRKEHNLKKCALTYRGGVKCMQACCDLVPFRQPLGRRQAHGGKYLHNHPFTVTVLSSLLLFMGNNASETWRQYYRTNIACDVHMPRNGEGQFFLAFTLVCNQVIFSVITLLWWSSDYCWISVRLAERTFCLVFRWYYVQGRNLQLIKMFLFSSLFCLYNCSFKKDCFFGGSI